MVLHVLNLQEVFIKELVKKITKSPKFEIHAFPLTQCCFSSHHISSHTAGSYIFEQMKPICGSVPPANQRADAAFTCFQKYFGCEHVLGTFCESNWQVLKHVIELLNCEQK